MLCLLLAFGSLALLSAVSADSSTTSDLLWPMPQSVSFGSDVYSLNAEAFTFSGAGAGGGSDVLNNALESYYKLVFNTPAPFYPSGAGGRAVQELDGMVVTVESADETLGLTTNENYTLNVTNGKAQLFAPNPYAALRGLETFSQLVYRNTDGSHTPHDTEPHAHLREAPSSADELDKESKKPDIREQTAELEAKYKRLMAEQKADLEKEREDRLSLTLTLSRLEEEIKNKASQIKSLEDKCDDLTSYNHTLLDEKSNLAKLLTEAEARADGSSDGAVMRQMEEDISRLRQQLDESDGQHSSDVEKKDKEINHLRMMLEDSHYQLAIAQSKLASLTNEKDQEIEGLKSKVDDLDIELSSEQSRYQQLAEEKRELEVQMSRLRSGGARPTFPPQTHTSAMDRRCGTNALDTTIQQPLMARDIPMTPPTTTTADKLRPDLSLDLTSSPHMRSASSPTPPFAYGPPHPSTRQNLPHQSSMTPMHHQTTQIPLQHSTHQPTYPPPHPHMRTAPISPQSRINYIPTVTPAGSYSRPSVPGYQRPGVHSQYPGYHTSVQPAHYTPSQSVSGIYTSSSIPPGSQSLYNVMGSPAYMSLDSTSESGIGSMPSGYLSSSLGTQGQGSRLDPRLLERRSSSPHDHINYPQ